MGALTTTELVKRLPIGDRMLKTFRATSNSTANTADEYITTGLRKIDAVVGLTVIGTTAAPVAATGTVTFSATDPTETETIVVGGVTYVLNASVATTGAYSVLLNNTQATQAANFTAAINRTATAGTTYSLYVPQNPLVSAVAATAVVTLTARVPGVVGNSITLTAAGGSTTVSGATLTGGADSVAGGNFVKNALGTGQTADTTLGALGIEFGAASVVFEVTVIGIP